MKKIALVIAILLLAVSVGYFFRDRIFKFAFLPTSQNEPVGISSDNAKEENDIEVVADELSIPWDLAFLPDGDILVTQRPGQLLRLGQDKQVIQIEGVAHRGEGGLLGVALHPDFEDNNFVYLYLTSAGGEGLINGVERYVLQGNELSSRAVIIDGIPGATFHDGGQIAFGPDELLYITTGDAGDEQSAQDIDFLSGKILRLNDDGGIPPGNPFGNEVYSYGHRNPQGLAWDAQDRLWATEHGRSGLRSGFDELNLIEAGKNYGWPVIEGGESQNGMESPKAHSGSSVTWAPASAAYLNGSIFFGGLRGQSLYQADITADTVTVVAHFQDEYGRIRAAVVGPDGFLYITTSNTDGRGQPETNDDKIIKINPGIFQ